ncbi:hypothetical protein [Ferrimonas balearica]|uniref:hypothetical protein n=1 Tax=Ferrimonas balearica TaxID=44012 RepID=UPI001C99AE80|nr:hypothetical protein [Ferrimonas balearica]MBY5920475.1 hypothetical protein [Ferrimonas balearica]MBY5996840.1 hypothetical protein [Ferrimonas balearica]
MSKLIKEEVIAQFTAAYLAKHGKAPQIEQKGSWFKVDDGKSVRLGELAEMAAELAGDAPVAAPEAKAAPVKKTAKPKAAPAKAQKAKVKASGDKGGLSPKDAWAKNLAKGSKMPRGF